MPRLAGLRPSRYACGLRGFSTGHPALAKNWPASLRATLRAFLHPPAAVIRGPKSQELEPSARAKTKAQSAQRWRIGNAKQALALSPQRFGRVAQRLVLSAVYRGRYPAQRTSTVQVCPLAMLRGLCSEGHFLWVTFLLGQQKKSDSSVGRRSKRPLRKRHAGGNATTKRYSSGFLPTQE